MWRGSRQQRSAPGATVLDILRAAGRGRDTAAIQLLDARQVRWATRTGLGPLLRRLTPPGSPLARSPAWPLVVGADLAARVESAERLEAVVRVLDAGRGRAAPPLLLKGISLCEGTYPEPHLRPMRDVDLLVDDADVPAWMAVLAELGYRAEEPHRSYAEHHHQRPMSDPRTGICVEVHHRLFPPRGALGSLPLFDAAHVRAHQAAGTLRGRPVRRMTPEMQLVYLAAHWSASAKLLEAPGGLLPLLDVLYLLEGGSVHWPSIVEWVSETPAAPAVYALLAYGTRRGVLAVPDPVIEGLRRGQRALGAGSQALLFRLIDRGAVQGRRAAPMLGRTGTRALWKALFLPEAAWRNLLRLPRLLRED